MLDDKEVTMSGLSASFSYADLEISLICVSSRPWGRSFSPSEYMWQHPMLCQYLCNLCQRTIRSDQCPPGSEHRHPTMRRAGVVDWLLSSLWVLWNCCCLFACFSPAAIFLSCTCGRLLCRYLVMMTMTVDLYSAQYPWYCSRRSGVVTERQQKEESSTETENKFV